MWKPLLRGCAGMDAAADVAWDDLAASERAAVIFTHMAGAVGAPRPSSSWRASGPSPASAAQVHVVILCLYFCSLYRPKNPETTPENPYAMASILASSCASSTPGAWLGWACVK